MFFATRNAAAGSPSAELDCSKLVLPRAHLSQIVMEAAARRVDVEETRTIRSGIRERVHDPDGRGDVRARSEAKPLVVDLELGLSFEHVERVDVIVMGMRVRPCETGLELELDQRELVATDLYRRDPVLTLETFASTGRKEDGFRSGATTARQGVKTVETAGLTAIAGLQIPRETRVRRVEIQEPRARGASEPMHDLPWSADAGARRQHLLLVVDQDREPALEDVERIRVLPVEVRIRSGARVREKRLGDAELVEVRLDDDPSAKKRLALAGSVHDSWHFGRV